MSRASLARRAFLTGLGGVVLALPWLESARRAARASDALGRPILFFRQANGVQQAQGEEPERFWPHETGALSSALLATRDADRAVSELAPHGDRLLLVKGTRHPFLDMQGDAHATGGAQLLTAMPPVGGMGGQPIRGGGESLDNRIARAFPNNGGEPLTLYTGPRTGSLEEVLSYRGANALRAAEDDPWVAYARMVGSDAGTLDSRLEQRRRSVNDLVREQMQALFREDLSGSDRQRLNLHFEAIREFETLTCLFTREEEEAMLEVSGTGMLNRNRVIFAKLHLDLVALAFSCDHVRAATLQMGDGNDPTEYDISGVRLPRYHYVSHRVRSDNAEGEAIDGAEMMHHDIDRLHAKTFAHFLQRMTDHDLWDRVVAVWTNDLGSGPSHTFRNIPWVIAGSAGGTLATGQFVDLGDVSHHQLLSTLATAVGVRKDDGSPLDDFGHSSLTPGLVDAILS